MLQALLQVAFPCWKIVLTAGVLYLTADIYTDDFLRYSPHRRLLAFSVVLIVVGLLLLFVVSPNAPTTAQFWLSWYFVDDIGVVLTAWGAGMLYKLVRFRRQVE